MKMNIGFGKNEERVEVKTNDLLTHGVILGRTGSGKTGATAVVVEEAVMSGASAIVIDPKGDLTNLALSFPGLTAEEFAPWVGEEDPHQVALRARNGLGALAPNVAKWNECADVTIFSPGKIVGGGLPVNILPSFSPPIGDFNEIVLREKASTLVTTILSAVGHNGDPMTDPANVFLTDALLEAWKRDENVPLDKWAGLLSDPPSYLHDIDGMRLNEFFPKKDRIKVARSLIGFRRQSAKWLAGNPLNIDNLVGAGKPKVSVFTLRHLSESDRLFFSAILLSSIVDFMFRSKASSDLKLLVVLDEAKGYLPPHPYNPPTKKPICTLLAQGRAQGIGVVVGTQNPADIDYKALSNVGTWFLGRLRERDCARDLQSELDERDVEVSDLNNLPQRHFIVLTKDGEPVSTRIRWAYSYLRGPIDSDELLLLEKNETVDSLVEQDNILRGNARIRFTLKEKNSLPCDIRLFYSKDEGVTWHIATTRNNTSGLASSPEGVTHRAIWDTIKDFGHTKCEVLLTTESDYSYLSEPSRFIIDNT